MTPLQGVVLGVALAVAVMASAVSKMLLKNRGGN
jgi:hypothetical protein